MSDELVTIAKFNTAFEAESAKDSLEANDIKAAVVGDDLVTMMVPMPEVTVELKVFAKDAERAKAVLETHKKQCQEAVDAETDAEVAGDDDETVEDA
ncbi:MAG: DUF2007 domain-containing protein [Planctomycetes bacterium]|nr:DUF2007 domain-containing protein [Planctomycetota bacterium]